MKSVKKLAVISLFSLAGNFMAHADDSTLVKPPSVAKEIAGQKPKLPVITPNGVMTLFGKKQVLFSVVGPVQSDGSSGESSCVLEVGEGQNGIKVLSVDDDSKMVTFDNHGTVQKIALQTATLVSAPAPAPAPAQPPMMTLQSAPLQPAPPVAPAAEEPQNPGGVTMVTIGSRPAANTPRFKHQLGLSAQDNQNQAGGAGLPPPPLPSDGAAAAPTEAPTPVMHQAPEPPQRPQAPGMAGGGMPH
jgi:hypothetical protein